MNHKQVRMMNRALRRARLNEAKDKVKAEVLAGRLDQNFTPERAKRHMATIDSCRSLGDVHVTRKMVSGYAQNLARYITP